MAWATKRASGKWQGKYRDAAGNTRSAGMFPTKRAAMKAAVDAEAAKPKTSVTWGEWVEHWWPTRGIEPSTAASEAGMVRKHIAPTFADTKLAEMSRHDIQAWAT